MPRFLQVNVILKRGVGEEGGKEEPSQKGLKNKGPNAMDELGILDGEEKKSVKDVLGYGLDST